MMSLSKNSLSSKGLRENVVCCKFENVDCCKLTHYKRHKRQDDFCSSPEPKHLSLCHKNIQHLQNKQRNSDGGKGNHSVSLPIVLIKIKK